MVIVDTSFKRIQELIKEKISIEELGQVLSDLGMELDNVEGDEIKIEITAERIDLITPEGLARAVNCYKGFTKKYEEVKLSTEKNNYVHKVDSSVKEYRPYTRSFVVKGLTFVDENIKSLMWIQEKIHDTYGRKRKKVAIGVYNLNKVNFPITYTVKKPEEIKFVPLGMNTIMNGREILQKHPTGKNYASLLEGFEYYPLQIDAKGQVLSLPPIINSDNLGKIDNQTKDIFVECTGPDEDSLDNVLNILATMFYDWGGKIFSVKIESENGVFVCPSLKTRDETINIKTIKNLIGLDLKPNEVVELLQKMEYSVLKTEGEKITVKIPSIRTDIWHEVDIADDVARGYGYNNIVPTLPNVSTIGNMLPLNILIEDICNFLIGFNLIELKTFALTNHQDQFEKMNLVVEEYVSLGKNTQDQNLNMVRKWLLPELIKALVANRNKEYPQNVFEIGTVIIPDNKKDVRARNVDKLTCLVCEDKTDFTKIKQVLDSIMSFLDLEYEIKETEHNSFIPGRVGRVLIQGKESGIVGEISPEVLEKWDLKMPLAGLELDLSKILKLLTLKK
ncbi:MAG: phenylalanine--tRNA ligase subunit beta [Nanoarchaeota archaeon]|nr:phenylalanine--tRNA ligase subunit beta [Nanoarchaeota archaeon]MBU1644462.1 phenylalanine--tRNA ligase subunit beta [Nanoarchaeota archaeon]MBU1976466.1 phenylalanine--tRNA ligase subunit beta [Nanoarchaeota archaeon]